MENITPEQAQEEIDKLPKSPRGAPLYGVASGREVEDIVDHPPLEDLLKSLSEEIAQKMREAMHQGYMAAKNGVSEENFNEEVGKYKTEDLLKIWSEEIKYK